MVRAVLALLLSLALLAAWAPPARAEACRVAEIRLSPSRARAKDTLQGLVILEGPAPPGGAYVQLSGPDNLWIPGTIRIPEGETRGTFVGALKPRTEDSEVVVVGTLAGVSVPSNRVKALGEPAPPPAPGPSPPPPTSASYWTNFSYGPYYPYYPYWYGPPVTPRPPVPPGPTYVPCSPSVGPLTGLGGISPTPSVLDFGNNVPILRP